MTLLIMLSGLRQLVLPQLAIRPVRQARAAAMRRGRLEASVALAVALQAPPALCGDNFARSPPVIEVTKHPTCRCCGSWITYLEGNGFTVRAKDVDDLTPLRQQLGVPGELAGCHTATVDGYVVEGHVSANEIRRLLTERPAIRGLLVPGMPRGAPGMTEPGAESIDVAESYDVIEWHGDGTTAVFAHHEADIEPPRSSSTAEMFESEPAPEAASDAGAQ